MDFAIPSAISSDRDRFRVFTKAHVLINLSIWNRHREIPKSCFRNMGAGGWYGFETNIDPLLRGSALREAMIAEELAMISPGVAVGAFDMAFEHMHRRTIFGKKLPNSKRKLLNSRISMPKSKQLGL